MQFHHIPNKVKTMRGSGHHTHRHTHTHRSSSWHHTHTHTHVFLPSQSLRGRCLMLATAYRAQRNTVLTQIDTRTSSLTNCIKQKKIQVCHLVK